MCGDDGLALTGLQTGQFPRPSHSHHQLRGGDSNGGADDHPAPTTTAIRSRAPATNSHHGELTVPQAEDVDGGVAGLGELVGGQGSVVGANREGAGEGVCGEPGLDQGQVRDDQGNDIFC